MKETLTNYYNLYFINNGFMFTFNKHKIIFE